MTTTTTSPLDRIEIASPCTAKWEEMTGDERMRRCAECRLDVYDISQMTRKEAEELLAQKVGRTCVRLWRRVDGTVITRDCPSAMRAAWKRVAWAAAALVAAGAAYASMFAPRGAGDPGTTRHVPPQPQPQPNPIMGDVIEPPRPMMGTPAPQPPQALMGEVHVPEQPIMGKPAVRETPAK